MSPSGHSAANRFFRRSAFGSRGGDSNSSLKERARAGKLKSPGSSVGGKPPVKVLSSEPLSSPLKVAIPTACKGATTNATTTTTPNKTNTSSISASLGVSSPASPENSRDECHAQAVRVAVRLRPLNPLEVLASKRSIPVREASSPSKSDDQFDSFKAWTVENHDGKGVLVQKGAGRKTEGKNMFSFDGVFQEHMGTAHVYDNFAKPIVQAVLEGRHGTIFTYGTSGSGKTHSMQGDGKNGSLHKDGIIQLAVRDLFNHIKKDSGKREYVMRISFFEIYNEQVRDLLATSHHNSSNQKSPTKSARPLSTTASRKSPSMRSVASGTSKFTFDSPSVKPQGKSIVLDSKKQQVSSVDDVLRLLYAGNQNRAVATTILNDTSSRSHAIFRLSIESRERVHHHHHHHHHHNHHHHHHHHNTPSDSDHIVRVSALNFVDLAGSENTARAATVGSRRRESGKINQSLLSLSQVIHALSLPPKKRPKFINYRNSKLTRILQPHLSGNAVLAILCCATPARANLEETRGTLKFGASAKRIQMKPVVNEIVDDKALIRKLQKDLKQAQDAIRAMALKGAATVDEESPAKDTVSPSEDLNVSMQVSTVATEMSAANSGSGTSGTGEREERFEASAERSRTPTHGRVEPSPLASPTMTPERVSSPNNLSASNLFEDMANVNALLQDGRHRSCDQDSGAERSIEQDDNSTLSDLSSRRPPNIRVVQDSPPSEVTIIRSPLSEMGDDVDINVRLDDAEERARFLEEKLEAADRLVELMTRDLRNARLCIHELVFRNVRLENQLAVNTSGTTLPSTVDVSETRTGSRSEDEMPSERIGI